MTYHGPDKEAYRLAYEKKTNEAAADFSDVIQLCNVFTNTPATQLMRLSVLIWGRLLLQVSRLDLNLVPSHPDGRCGLGFLGGNALAMGPFLMAHSVLLSGFLANRILYEGTRLPDYKLEILVMALFLYLLALGPVCVFTPRLLRQRLHGLYTYGPLASEYVIEFEKKWMEGERPSGEPLVGTADIQSLADLANSFAVVQHIQPFPFGREAVIAVALFIALPILPLTLTMFSFQELATRLLKILFLCVPRGLVDVVVNRDHEVKAR